MPSGVRQLHPLALAAAGEGVKRGPTPRARASIRIVALGDKHSVSLCWLHPAELKREGEGGGFLFRPENSFDLSSSSFARLSDNARPSL